jgi:hyperosmotically inducible protein
MKIKSVLLGLCMCGLLVACGPKDADIEKAIASKMGDMPGITVDVKDGVATISGTCNDNACKENCGEIARGIKGVKSVVNNIEVAPAEPIATPVVINPDSVLSTSVNEVVQSYSGVNAAVADGVVTLTGTIKRDQLPMLIQRVQELKPKKVENQLTIK